MAANLFQPSVNRVLDSNGNPVPGARMSFYLTGTSTPATWFTDAEGTVPGTNPLIADAAGLFPIPAYMDPDTTYRITLTDATGANDLWPPLDPVRGFDETQLSQAAFDAVAAAGAAEDARDAANDARQEAEAARDAADLAASNSAQAALSAEGYYPGARSFVPRGATTGSIPITTPGSGGTNGTFALGFSGGNFGTNPSGTFTVAGGVVTAINITGPGLYVGASPSAPSLSFSASTGLTGASASLTVRYLRQAGEYYLTDHATDPYQAALFQNQGNNAVEVNPSVGWLNISEARAATDPFIDALPYIALIPEITESESERLGPFPVQAGTGAGFAVPVTLVIGQAMPYDGTIGEIQYDIRSIGTGGVTAQVCSGDPAGAGLTVLRSIALPTPSAIGLQTVPGAPLGNVSAGQWITLASPTDGARFSDQQAAAGNTRYYRNSAHVSGTQAYTAASGGAHRANFTAVRPQVKVPRENINDTDAGNLAVLEASASGLAALPEIVGTVSETTPYGLRSADISGTNSFGGPIALMMLNVNATIAEAGALSNITVPIQTLGSGVVRLFVGTRTGTSFVPRLYLGEFTATATGDFVLTASNFGAVNVLPGETIFTSVPTGGPAIKSRVGGALGSYYNSTYWSSADVGVTKTLTNGGATASQFGGYFEVTSSETKIVVEEDSLSQEVQDKLNGNSGDYAPAALAKAAVKPVIIFEANFGGSLPADWSTQGAGWTNPTGGLLSPVGDGNFDKLAFATMAQNKVCSSEQRFDRFVFRPATAGLNMWIGLGRNSGIRRTVVHVDSVNGRLAFANYNSINFPRNTGFPTESTIFAAMAALATDRDYSLEMTRNSRIVTARLIDLKTNTVLATISEGTNTAVVLESTPRIAGDMFGAPGVQIVAGQVLLKSVTQEGRIKNPRVQMIGDSRTHSGGGYGLIENQRWSAQVRDALGGSGVIAAHDGATGFEFIPLMINEMIGMKPDWLVEVFGTNDTDTNLAAYTAQLDALLAACDANGIRLAVAILPPATGRTLTQINAYKLALPNRVRKIRFDLALTTNNDGTTIDLTKTDGNSLHPGLTGQNLMFAQIKSDLPEIFA